MKTKPMIQPVPREPNDYRLLLDRLHKAPFDEAGAAYVHQALIEGEILTHIDAQAMLQLAVIARQHGLIDQALAVYERIHERFPECEDGWQQHIEILLLLDDRRTMVQIQGRATQYVSQQTRKIWQKMCNAESSADTEQVDTDIIAPFQQLRREEEQVNLFMRLFQGREDAFARQWVNRKEEKQGYVPVRRPMQSADIRDHLAGHRTYGSLMKLHTGRLQSAADKRIYLSRLQRINSKKYLITTNAQPVVFSH